MLIQSPYHQQRVRETLSSVTASPPSFSQFWFSCVRVALHLLSRHFALTPDAHMKFYTNHRRVWNLPICRRTNLLLGNSACSFVMLINANYLPTSIRANLSPPDRRRWPTCRCLSPSDSSDVCRRRRHAGLGANHMTGLGIRGYEFRDSLGSLRQPRL
ncbi:hypothetical protein J6590_064545 [Homalodisca vitripennis]|nr:hypothetical protein J6590_064545 [Homalodisca vitripennis]